MGGTGLEPVTPSLSIRGGVRAGSLCVRPAAWLSGIVSRATERLSERERTLSVAIVATTTGRNSVARARFSDQVPSASAAACSIVSAAPAAHASSHSSSAVCARAAARCRSKRACPPGPKNVSPWTPALAAAASRAARRASPLAAATAASPYSVKGAWDRLPISSSSASASLNSSRASAMRPSASAIQPSLSRARAGLAPDADLARECERLRRVVAGSGQVSGPERRIGEVAERQRHPGEVAHLGTDAVALLVTARAPARVPSLGAPHAEVVQGGAEDERISRLLGDAPELLPGRRVLVDRRLRARSGGG